MQAFYAEAWEGLLSRYTPDRGSWASYVQGAFIRFARRRILRLRRYRHQTVSLEQLSGLAFPQEVPPRASPDENPELSLDVDRVSAALARLPGVQSEVLMAYVDLDSEREVATRLGLTRYRVREYLAEGMGRLALQLSRPPSIPEKDWAATRVILEHGHTAKAAASILGWTPERVQRAHQRNLSILVRNLREATTRTGSVTHSPRATPKRPLHQPPTTGTMETEHRVTAHDLLRKVLQNPGEEHLLVEVQHRAEEIVELLDGAGSDELFGYRLDETDPEWLGRVYSSLWEGAIDADADTPLQPLLEAVNNEEEAVGAAYQDALLPDLPRELRDLGAWLEGLPTVEDAVRSELASSPAAQAGEAEHLAQYGVTPLTVLYTADAVGYLLERLQRYDRLSSGDIVLRVVGDAVEASLGDLDGSALVAEVIDTTGLSPEVAARLLQWIVNAAAYKPWLIDGFESEPVREGKQVAISLRTVASQDDDLYRRWATPAYDDEYEYA